MLQHQQLTNFPVKCDSRLDAYLEVPYECM